MIELVVGYVLGILSGAGAWLLFGSMLAHPAFKRVNYRGHELVTSGGVVMVLAFSIVVGVNVLVREFRGAISSQPVPRWDALMAWAPATLAIALAFCLLGLLDDIAGTGQSGGFRGHLAAAFGGNFTTGLIKLVGGPLFALVIISDLGISTGRAGVLRDAALVSLAANLANLFDRAPGRTNKIAQLCLLVVLGLVAAAPLVAAALFGGTAAGLLMADLREDMMLGDAGSNALGAVVGLSVVIGFAPSTRWWVVAGLLVANVASELVSFTRVIDAVPPLRYLDRLGAVHRAD